jgi:hypothetical protein
MIHLPPDNREALVAYIVGLAVACPMNQDNPSQCPFHEWRQKSMNERYTWINSLSDGELRRLANHHCSCLATKEDSL